MLFCKYCGKECKNNNSHKNHERCCPANLNRNYKNGMTGKKGTNHYAKGAVMSYETKKKISVASKGKKVSLETKQKLSIARTEWMKLNPDKTRRKKSYMELSFITWLDSYDIKYENEVHFRNTEINKNYFVDFLFADKNLIVELDGNQHEKRKESDRIRDEYFVSLGYTVIRITHKDYINKTRIDEIKMLLGCVER